jgi:hypothetical protein
VTNKKMYVDPLCGVPVTEEQLRETDEGRLKVFQRLLEGGDLSPEDQKRLRRKIAVITRKWRKSA